MSTETIEGQQDTATEAANDAAEQAAAAAAFGEIHGGEVTQSQPEAAAETTVVEEPAPPEMTDAEREKLAEQEWLKGVPTALRESLSAISGITGRLRNVEGHIGGLTSVTKELRAAMTAAKQAAAEAGADAPTDAQVASANTMAKWKAMAEDFPDWAEAMEERLTSIRGGAAVDVDGITKKVTESFTPLLEDVGMRARQFARVDIAHEDWEDTVKTPEFSTWLQAQPEDMQALAASERARDAIKLLDAFAASKKKAPSADEQPTQQQQTRTRLAQAITPTKGQTVTRREPMSEQEAADAAFKRIRSG